MLATSKWFNLFFQFIRERIDLEALMLLSEADLGEVGFDFDLVSENGDKYDNNDCEDVGDADNKNDNYYDNSDYYQRCWGCRWAPGKSCWKQLRREGDNFVKRLQQSSRTFFIIENIFIVVMIFITKKFYHHLNTWMLQQTAGRKGLLHHGDISTQRQLTRFLDVTKLASLQITLSSSSSDPNV